MIHAHEPNMEMEMVIHAQEQAPIEENILQNNKIRHIEKITASLHKLLNDN